jgi:hypothetical protein
MLTRNLSVDKDTQLSKLAIDTSFGYSMESIYNVHEVKGNEGGSTYYFDDEDAALDLWRHVFGDIHQEVDIKYRNNFMKQVKEIMKSKNSHQADVSVIMAYLPSYHIQSIEKATYDLLVKYNVLPDTYNMVILNGKDTKDSKQSLDEAILKARNEGKRHLLVLTGKQCSMGVTIPECDVVLLMNTTSSFDTLFQMSYRCMSEREGKTCAVVVDFNIHRMIHMVSTYTSMIKPKETTRNALTYVLRSNIININPNEWKYDRLNGCRVKISMDTLIDSIQNLYMTNVDEHLKLILDRLKFKEQLMKNMDIKSLNTWFKCKRSIKNTSFKSVIEEPDTLLSKGIEKEYKEYKESVVDTFNNDEKPEEEPEEEPVVKFMDIITTMIPLLCLFTVGGSDTHTTTFQLLLEYALNHHIEVLLSQMRYYWGYEYDITTVSQFIEDYKEIMKHNHDIEFEIDKAVKEVKDIFIHNFEEYHKMSEVVDKYLVPTNHEKKVNAEISTPESLRKDMLDALIKYGDPDFFKKPQRVLEPCAGKGGFLVSIIDRFMDGLKDLYPDPEERYKFIVENCIYYADINPTNIFICKLILDPMDKYNLHAYQGDTLKMDIKEVWALDGFDAVIGNPPYNAHGKTGTGNTIWQHFTRKSLESWINPQGYIVMVHPCGWRKPNTSRGKFNGLFKLMVHDHQMLYLSIHGIKDGQRTFNCGTRYDWYILQNSKPYVLTTIIDYFKVIGKYNLQSVSWLPNYALDKVWKLLKSGDTCYNEHEQSASAYDSRKPWVHGNVIYNRNNYGSDKSHVHPYKDTTYKYPLIHSTPKSGVRYMYSSRNDLGHFGIPKVIFGQSGVYTPVVDLSGMYGMTEHAMGIVITPEDDVELLTRVLESDSFTDILKACSWSNYMIDWRLFTYFKKNWYKELDIE